MMRKFYFLAFLMFISYVQCWSPVLLSDIDDYKSIEAPYARQTGQQYYDIFMQEAHNKVDDVKDDSRYKVSKAYRRPAQCRSLMHQFSYKSYSNHTQNLYDNSKIIYRAMKKILDTNKIPYSKAYDYLKNIYVPKELCPYADITYKCDRSNPYREYDGSCNNLRNPGMGQVNTPMKRLIRAQYDDSLSDRIVKSKTGNELPNPRMVSYILNQPNDMKIKLNALTIFYSQFIDHDITLTALVPGDDGKPKPCECDTDDEDCINIPTHRSVAVDQDQNCMVVPRSLGVFTRMDCKLGPRDQMNALTHWCDLSQVYGTSVDDNAKLRTFQDGLMKVSFINGIKYEQLPFEAPGEGTCKNTDGLACFKVAEVRGNQNLPLLSLHTIYLRQHNRIARLLKSVNPHLNDNDLYELTRRVNIAIYQHILYKDWLPIIVGKQVSKIYDTSTPIKDYFYGYNPDINAHIYTEFASAAYRFGHTHVFSWLTKYDSSMRINANISLTASLLKTTEAYRDGGLDAILRALYMESTTAYDRHISDTLENSLFVNTDPDAETHHFSLGALNINRNNDHGLPSYTEYRKLCGLKGASTFKDLDNIPHETLNILESLYEKVDDIPLFVGGICEKPLGDAIVGPTFSSIIAMQFKNLKYGDRHYYENGHDEKIRFTLLQLNEIRKASFSRILCDNMDLEYLPKNPWFILSDDNPPIKCSEIDEVNFDVFKV